MMASEIKFKIDKHVNKCEGTISDMNDSYVDMNKLRKKERKKERKEPSQIDR